MRFSRSLKSSAHAIPSPDGQYIATILTSKLILRSTRSLEISRVISLPEEFTISPQWFLWSLSSRRVLICTSDCIFVYSAADQQFAAKISNPTSGTAKITSISFGATDDEVLVFADFGLKMTVFNLSTSTSIEIVSPKFYNSINCSRGYAYRPRIFSLALLTRSGGKDIISIHCKNTYKVLRSWHSDTIDAQELKWSPDGKWLAVVDSAAHGHKILFYTADGHLFKIWNGPISLSDDDRDLAVGAGVRLIEWACTADYLAVGDYTSRVVLLSEPSFIDTLSLNHTTTIKPVNGLQIWQEHVKTSQNGGFERNFALCTNTICPPTTGSLPATSDSSGKSGTSSIVIDASGTLIASRSEAMPTTIWIWDIPSKVLRTAMILHAPIAKVTWHPIINELLMIRCEGEESKGLAHLWEPSWEEGPKMVDFGSQVPEGKIIGKSVVRWLNCDSSVPAIFFSDSQDCILAVVSSSEVDDLPWQDASTRGFDIYGQREESPLNLVAADEKTDYARAYVETLIYGEPTMTGLTGGTDEADDTFHFKKLAHPWKEPNI